MKVGFVRVMEGCMSTKSLTFSYSYHHSSFVKPYNDFNSLKTVSNVESYRYDLNIEALW